jgi:steroid delta-isomerase
MQAPDRIRAIFARYVELVSAGKSDAIADLYAKDATLEDPIGAPQKRGREAIREFYAASAGAAKLELTGPVRVCGREAAAPMQATLTGADGKRAFIDIIDVMSFGEDGLITSMRAYWSPDAIRREG